MDLKTSLPLAIMDGSHITAYRTGAAGAVAAGVLARKDAATVGVIGTGTQGRMQILALRELFKLEKILAWNIRKPSAERYATEMSERLGIDVKAVDGVEAAVRDVDIVVTATPSREALVMNDWIREGVHINAIGADGPGKQELDPKIVGRADKVVVDSLSQCRRIGEIQHALTSKLLTEEGVHAEIGHILLGERPGRESERELTVFDSTGMAAQDIAAAHVVYEQAKERGLGQSVNLLNL
jgi:ornithine cyclodeaminase/alanine dehydrogenase